jgi:hypothetical protein
LDLKQEIQIQIQIQIQTKGVKGLDSRVKLLVNSGRNNDRLEE